MADDLHTFLSGEGIKARPDSARKQIARAVSRIDRNLVHFRRWSQTCLAFAPVPPVILFFLVYWYRNRADYPQLAVIVSMVTIFGVQTVLQLTARNGLQLVPSRLRRHIHIVLTTNMTASAASVFAVWWNCPDDRTDVLLLIFPILTAITSVLFFSLASEIGFFFVIGTLVLLATIPMSLYLPWSPFGVGLLMMCDITGLGLFFRWMTTQSEIAASVGPVD